MNKRISRKKKIIKNNIIKGGEHKNVLVLCQRKTGMLSQIESTELVENIVIPVINRYINMVMGSDTSIIYVTSINREFPGTADYECYLQIGSPCTTEFISQYGRNSFDFILLQTCPNKYFNYDIIHTLLKPDGYLGFSKAPNSWSDEIINDNQKRIKSDLIQHVLSKNFVLDVTNVCPDIILFKNIQHGGKNNKRKSRIHVK